ncbi:YceD family protein [Alicyclobacillus kakegawensis]|uniref:YceD family protein n=1 Tax=Alicyclobacillus kakegawensis TaxID=392012 RepID=UPI0008343BA0|nr:DUF177 domain-containing protein [Alicyclobacillus kakegawensis]
MQLELEQAKRRPMHVEGVVELPRIAQENPQVARIQPVAVRVDVDFTKSVYRLRAALATEVEYVCSRCLESFTAPLQTEFTERLRVLGTEAAADEDILTVDSPTVLLDPYVEQALNLALEYRPLCREGCRGLCVECGCNLNERQCSCETKRVDPRLAVLQDLLSKDDSE